jgi:hypothetical protein
LAHEGRRPLRPSDPILGFTGAVGAHHAPAVALAELHRVDGLGDGADPRGAPTAIEARSPLNEATTTGAENPSRSHLIS